MRFVMASMLTLLLAGRVPADVKMPAEIKGKAGTWIVVVPTEKDGGEVKFKLGAGLTKVDLGGLFPGLKTNGVVVTADKDGTYEIWAWNAKGDVASDLAVTRVVVGDGKPTPPTPPTPPVPPDPPTPPPTPSPIPVAGFRVLIVYQDSELAPLGPGHTSVIYGKTVRDELNARCVKDADNPNGAWRIWDADADVSNVGKTWQDAFKRAKEKKTKYPWVLVSDHPKGGYEGPLPSTVEKMVELLKSPATFKYAPRTSYHSNPWGMK